MMARRQIEIEMAYAGYEPSYFDMASEDHVLFQTYYSFVDNAQINYKASSFSVSFRLFDILEHDFCPRKSGEFTEMIYTLVSRLRYVK